MTAKLGDEMNLGGMTVRVVQVRRIDDMCCNCALSDARTALCGVREMMLHPMDCGHATSLGSSWKRIPVFVEDIPRLTLKGVLV